MKINRIFVIVIVIISSILLFSCKNNDTITITYITNGGSNITSTELNTSDISAFTLPDEPTLEGFRFVGWYVDQECLTPFDKLTEAKDTTLFAKWEKLPTDKSYNLDIDFNFSINQTELTHQGTIKVFMKDTDPQCFNDLSFYIDIRIKEVNNTLNIDEEVASLLKNFRFMVYINESKLYLCIPGKLFPIGNITLGNVFTSIDIINLINTLVEEIGPQAVHYFPRITNIDNFYTVSVKTIINTLLDDLTKYLNLLDYFGFDKELFNEFVKEFVGIIDYFINIDLKNINPTEVQELIINKLNEVFDLFIQNAHKALPVIDLLEKYHKSPILGLKMYDNHFFINELPYYFDNMFNVINYKEDVDCRYGYINEYGIYIPNYSNMYVFDTNNNYQPFKVSKKVTYSVDGRNVQVFFSSDGLSYMLDTGEIKPFNTIKEYLNQDILKVVSEADNVYKFGDFYYDKDYNLLNEEDIFEVLYLHDSVTKNYYKTIELIKNNFRINSINVTTGETVNIEINTTYSDDSKDYNAILNININSYKDSNFDPKVNPKYYADFTNKIVEMIVSEVEYYLIY